MRVRSRRQPSVPVSITPPPVPSFQGRDRHSTHGLLRLGAAPQIPSLTDSRPVRPPLDSLGRFWEDLTENDTNMAKTQELLKTANSRSCYGFAKGAKRRKIPDRTARPLNARQYARGGKRGQGLPLGRRRLARVLERVPDPSSLAQPAASKHAAAALKAAPSCVESSPLSAMNSIRSTPSRILECSTLHPVTECSAGCCTT